MKNWKQTKIGKFIDQYHLIYLAIPFCLWGVKALFYNIAIWIEPVSITFQHTIDSYIPFIKYFVIFYLVYYYLPQFVLWILSFFDKKKYWIILCSLGLCVLVCFLFYLAYNVRMERQPGYPNGIGLKDIKDVSTFFDYLINWVYLKDPHAMNCFPSLHAVVGMMLVFIGFSIPFDRKKRALLPFRIVVILCGLGCILSTIFIKQHYFMDMIAGVILAIMSYGVVTLCFWLLEKRKARKSCISPTEEV